MRSVHVVVPGTVDDATRPSGGNTYDRRVCAELRALGWTVHVHPVGGGWPRPDPQARAGLAGALARLPDGSTTVVDGLLASCSPEVVVPEAGRLRLVVLVHLPLGAAPGGGDPTTRAAEVAALSAAAAVVTTSRWTRSWLLHHYALAREHLLVAEPGVDLADLAPGTPDGGGLLCVAAVVPAKGQDRLVSALARLRDLPWTLTCAGAADLDPAFVEQLLRTCEDAGVAGRVRLLGPLTAQELDRAYARADVLVLASSLETYGMVVAEALARGLPVVATAVGGLPEAVGRAPDGTAPGLLVPAGDIDALADALRAWLGDADLRQRLRVAARERRPTLSSWATPARRIADLLSSLQPLPEPSGRAIRDTL